MKISQLMVKLNKIKSKHGDLTVNIEYADNEVSCVFISSEAQEEYGLSEDEKPSIKEMKEDGFEDDDIKNMIKKYVIIG